METLIARFSDEPERQIEFPLRLITNQDHFRAQIEGIMRKEVAPADLKVIIDPLMAYLETTGRKPGSSEGCPFTPLVAAHNGYFLSPNDQNPIEEGALATTFSQLLSTHQRLSPIPTQRMDPFDFTVVLAPFTHREANGEAFANKLVEAHRRERLTFIKKGLMVAHAGPYHKGGVQSGFCAPMPTLIARRMHQRDRYFMNTDEEKAAFELVYGQDHF